MLDASEIKFLQLFNIMHPFLDFIHLINPKLEIIQHAGRFQFRLPLSEDY